MRRALAAAAALSALLTVTPAASGEAHPPATSRGAHHPGRAHQAPRTCPSRRRPAITSAYRRMRTRWHSRAPRGMLRTWLAAEVKPLVIRPVHGRERFELVPDPVTGRFDETQLSLAREAFRYHEDQATTDVNPRLLELAYRAVVHFEVPYVTLVSGYRTTRATSRHNQGRAMDVVFPGVSDRGLAAFLRRQGFVGVGVYPLSGFVHLDVRERSFFWVDSSAPGRRSRVRGVAPGEALRNDRAARRRGEEIVPDLPELLAGEGEGELVDAASVPSEESAVADAPEEPEAVSPGDAVEPAGPPS